MEKKILKMNSRLVKQYKLTHLMEGKNKSDESCSISCMDGFWETRSYIACDCECMMHNYSENVYFAIGKEGEGGTTYSQSSSEGDRRRGEGRYKLVGMGGNAFSLGGGGHWQHRRHQTVG